MTFPPGRAVPVEDLLGPLNDVEQKFAPPTLYVAGDPEVLRMPRVAVIGSRKATAEGLAHATELARFFARSGVAVVSGLAEGIDTAAHEAAIQEGRTVAVLGTPLDQVYPAANRMLQDRIMREHLAISQFAPGTPVGRGSFILRNRTMALVSHASVIVEAGETSGSLSQGWETLRLGHPLFLHRSIIEDGRLAWPRKMLEYGAVVLEKPEEVLEVLPSRAGIDLDVAL